MNREEILDQIKTVIYDCFPDLRDADLREETVVNTETAIDSMGFILVICKLESLFGIKIPQRQWSKLSTLGDVADAVTKALQKK